MFAVVVRVADGIAIAIGVAAGLLLIAILASVWRGRRALVRRVVNSSLRLEEGAPGTEHRFLDKNLGRLERAVDASVLARGEATVATGRAPPALHTILPGAALRDET